MNRPKGEAAMNDEWTLYVAIVLLVMLLAGTPDLLDAIIAWVGRQP
jgi:hypothetical protein